MNWVRPYITTVATPMIPDEHHAQIAKRKMPDDPNPLANASKRLKKEGSAKPNAAKRKLLNGEEQLGGLVIVRAPPSRPPSTQPPDQPQSQSQPQPHHPPRPPSAGPSQPPSKKFKSDSRTGHRPVGKAKERDLVASSRPDPEVDEDVRLMNDEAEHLRRRSRANAEPLKSDFNFPAVSKPPTSEQVRQGRPLTRNGDTQHGRRKSSLSTRGKRVSTAYDMSGVITQPHPSVSDASFYKHIDADLPEAQRARQLLIWCSSRATNRISPSSSHPKSNNSGKDPPASTSTLTPLSADAAKLLKGMQEDVIRMLAEKQIDTNVYGMSSDASVKKMKPNEQNIKNRAREVRFGEHIERAKGEDGAWDEVVHFYNSHQSRVLSALDERRKSAKAKGKQRADFLPRENELADEFRGPNGIELAREVLAESGEQDPLSSRLQDLEFTIDRLQSVVQTCTHTTHYASDMLDHRFALLTLSLSSHGPLPSSHLPSLTSSLLPPTQSLSSTTDPQEMLRALSRIDAERPPAQVGDAARRAVREVQRATAPGVLPIHERKLTVAPPTPRTPRRPGTPGRGR